jgi:carbon monoxide dehydrogenase subunit G
MDLSGTQHFNKSPQEVWNALQNADALKGAFPGLQAITWQGNSVQVQAHVSVGPITRDINSSLDVSEATPPNHLKLAVNRSSGSGTVTLDLADDGSGGTNMTYAANIALSGPLALLDGAAKPFADNAVKQALSNLSSSLG